MAARLSRKRARTRARTRAKSPSRTKSSSQKKAGPPRKKTKKAGPSRKKTKKAAPSRKKTKRAAPSRNKAAPPRKKAKKRKLKRATPAEARAQRRAVERIRKKRRSAAAQAGWKTRRKNEAARRRGIKRRKKEADQKRARRRKPKARKREVPTPPARKKRGESQLIAHYFRDVLHSTCGRMRDEGLVCNVRVHVESDGSVSGEIVVPVPPPGTKENDVRLLLITLEELDGWSANPSPGKAWITIIFRVDSQGAGDQKYPVKVAPSRATYNVATNYHHLENAPYAFQIARDEILPGLLEAGRAIIAIVMRVRYMPHGEHPTRPRI